MPLDQFNGVHLLLAQFVSAMPFDSTKHYEDYLAHLNQVPHLLDQVTDVLKQGEKDKLLPPRFLLEKVVKQCEAIAEPAGEASAFFFFQAEDGIRDYKVTGVQTCALPICADAARARTD